MNDGSKFRALPKLGDFTIPFKLEETALLNWLVDLTQIEAQEACSQTISLLQTLHKTELSFKNRLAFLKHIKEYLKQYISNLEGSCWEAGFPLSIEESVYAEMVAWNYLLLGQGFFIAADSANKKNDAVLALAMALHTLGQAQLHIAATYSIPGDGFWQQLYQVFAWAEKKKLQDLEIEDKEFKGLTVHILFARHLIFHICDTNQFHPKEMRTIFNFLPQVCVNLPLVLYSSQEELFMLDLKSDNPPCNVNAQTELGSDLVRYFSPVMVANAIEDIIEKGEVWNGTLRSINNSLFTRVAKTLGLKQKRQYHRKIEDHSLLGVIGFDDIVGFLYKATKNTLIDPQKIKRKTAENSEPTSHPANTSSLTGLSILEKTENHSPKKNLFEAKKQIMEEPQASAVCEIPIKKVLLKEIKVCDSSANGYSVSWNQVHTKAKIGDLFGIISEDKKRLEIAIIRRIALNSGSDFRNDFRFGAELLGFESEIVYLCAIDSEAGNLDTWGILIPGIELLERPDTLIYSMGHFNIGENIYMYRGDKIIHVSLCKELHSTIAISHVEITLNKEVELSH